MFCAKFSCRSRDISVFNFVKKTKDIKLNQIFKINQLIKINERMTSTWQKAFSLFVQILSLN